jgi:hypothetical protein
MLGNRVILNDFRCERQVTNELTYIGSDGWPTMGDGPLLVMLHGGPDHRSMQPSPSA